MILPVYDREAFVGEAIRSILNQSVGDFELIVVDDGSTDSSLEVIQSFKDSRIRVIPKKKNRGAAAARNEGVRRARGKWITFFDSDDLMPRHSLGVRLRALKHSQGYHAVMGRMDRVIASPHHPLAPQVTAWKEEFYRFVRRLGEMPMGLGRKLISGPFYWPAPVVSQFLSASLVRRVGLFDKGLKFYEDFDYALRVNERAPSLFVDAPVLHYRQHQTNLSFHGPMEDRVERLKFLKKWGL